MGNSIGYKKIRVKKTVNFKEEDSILESIENVLKNHEKIREIKIDGEEITCRWGITLWSFGEKIIVRVETVNRNKRVTVKSEPVVKTTLVDYGKNRKNVEDLIDKITNEIHHNSEGSS